MKKYFFLLLASILLLSGCAKAPPKDTDTVADAGESANGEYTFNAVIKSIDETVVLVEVCEYEEVFYSSDQITFSYKGLDAIMTEVGDIVTISYTGVMTESYPAQITALSWSIYKKHTTSPSKNPHARFNIDDFDEDFTLAEYSYEDVFMSVKLPIWWEYEVVPYDPEMMDSETPTGFGICFWHESAPDLTYKLLYRVDKAGICGVGVTFDEITLQNGEQATIAMSGSQVYHVEFSEPQDHYALYVVGSNYDNPQQTYQDEIQAIIKTIELGGDI